MLAMATITGKAVMLALGLLGRKGSALPGLVIEKLYPAYLERMLSQLPEGVIVVTGTNGKTTTTKIISRLLESDGLRVLTNPTGSNFVRGVFSAIAKRATIGGRLPYDIAVLEQDEAHAVHFVNLFKPRGVVVLNVMRDQMDRFGEIDATARLLGKVTAQARDWLVLNANDRRVAALKDGTAAERTVWFGHNEELLPQFVDDDQLHRSRRLTYFAAAAPAVLLDDINGRELSVKVNGEPYRFTTILDGAHNAINIAAALATLVAVRPRADIKAAVESLGSVKPVFGRGEIVDLPSGGKLRLQLVKNPAGLRHSLALLADSYYDTVGFAINDNDPDGRDVSWLWDVDFAPVGNYRGRIVCGGQRAYDMAVRLKYDGAEDVEVKAALDAFAGSTVNSKNAVVFCTYTAMNRLRRILKGQGVVLASEGL